MSSHPIPSLLARPSLKSALLPKTTSRKRKKGETESRSSLCLFCCATTYPTSQCALHTQGHPLSADFLTDIEYGARSYFAAAATAVPAAGAADAAAAVVFVLAIVLDVVAVVAEVVVDPAAAVGALVA